MLLQTLDQLSANISCWTPSNNAKLSYPKLLKLLQWGWKPVKYRTFICLNNKFPLFNLKDCSVVNYHSVDLSSKNSHFRFPFILGSCGSRYFKLYQNDWEIEYTKKLSEDAFFITVRFADGVKTHLMQHLNHFFCLPEQKFPSLVHRSYQRLKG